MSKYMPVIDRFWQKVDTTGDCWMWTGSLNGKGYGVFWDADAVRLVLAHRYGYELAKGTIPDGLVVDHTCRQRACVHPDHLDAVTTRENNHRMFDAIGWSVLARRARSAA